jgi:hypothetical protein
MLGSAVCSVVFSSVVVGSVATLAVVTTGVVVKSDSALPISGKGTQVVSSTFTSSSSMGSIFPGFSSTEMKISLHDVIINFLL